LKKLQNISFIIILFFTGSYQLFAQSAPIDDENRRQFFYAGFGGGIAFPGGDLAERFGETGIASTGIHFKSYNNWLIGVDFDFFFGQNVKEDTILRHIGIFDGGTYHGSLIGTDGLLYIPDLGMRGFKLQIGGGKILPLLSPNPNSGLVLQGHVGFLQHKIRYYIQESGNVPQLNDEIKKGYDRLTNGISFSEFIGYQHFSDNKLINFSIGLEFTQALTQNRRTLNYDTMERDDTQRLDLMYAIKARWILPFYRRQSTSYY